MFHVDTGADCQQLLRHLGEHPASVPVWRRQRPALMIEAASFRPATAEEQVRGGGSSLVQAETRPHDRGGQLLASNGG